MRLRGLGKRLEKAKEFRMKNFSVISGKKPMFTRDKSSKSGSGDEYRETTTPLAETAAATLLGTAKDFTTLDDATQKFAAQGVTRDRRVICYCGGGISATIDLFLLHQLGYDKLTLYDGSMGEWAKDSSLPIETD